MKLRTSLSFSQVMVASLVLIFSFLLPVALHNQHAAFSQPPKNDEVLQLRLVKGFQCHSNYSMCMSKLSWHDRKRGK